MPRVIAGQNRTAIVRAHDALVELLTIVDGGA
jgi:hypothetical protein